MATRAIDRNIAALISDVGELKDRLRKLGDDDGPQSTLLRDIVNGYLVLNAPVIERAADAWAATPEAELAEMEAEHRELDVSAAHHGFREVAMQAVADAQEALPFPPGVSLALIDEDDLHMLGRMLDYAKYLANSDDLELEWSPVGRVIDNPEAPGLLEHLRAQTVGPREPDRTSRRPRPATKSAPTPPDAQSASSGSSSSAASASATPGAAERTAPDAEPDPEPEPAPEPQPAEDRGRDYRPSATISRDYWTVDDRLGYDFYADAVAAFIQHRDTQPPLTIGIKAPWGAGKTSLMRMIRARLDPDPTGDLRSNRAGDTNANRATITNREALKGTKLAREERDVKVDELEAGTDSHRPTVWFNAWMYQEAEQVWAGLADAIISQLTARMPTYARERFWAQLNLRRIDTDVVRRRIYTALVQRLLPWVLAIAVLWALALTLLLVPGAREVGAGIGAAGLSVGVASLVRVRKFFSEPVAGAFGELVSAPDYKGKAGYMQHVHADMQRVLSLVTTAKQPVVVFVDDLDRCTYGSVAKVIEAINLFLAGEFPNCIFVIAMEPDLVAAQIEVAYKDVFDTVKVDLPEREQGQLGWRFLEKMVQLPLSLPPPNTAQVGTLIDSILSDGMVPRPQIDADAVRRAREQISQTARGLDAPVQDELLALSEAAKQLAGTPGLEPETLLKAAEAEFDERFNDKDPVVQQAIRTYASSFSSNPREIKRFINVFRFYSFIQVRRDLRDLESPTYDQLAKLSALAIHWPHLLGLFGQRADGGRSVLEFLEDVAVSAQAQDETARNRAADEATGNEPAPTGTDVWADAVKRGKFPEGRCLDLMAPDLRALLAQEPMIGSSAGGFL